jgi:arginyl-tRNA--protein-N-Asp/Glu arginylyltransferase
MSEQQVCHWPSWALPVLADGLTVTPRQVCGYLPGRLSTFRVFEADTISAEAYQRLQDAGFRRSGTILYQPMCAGCRECVPLRVPVATFAATRSLRRALRRNGDLTVQTGAPEPTHEKWELYDRYQRQWHRKTAGESDDVADFVLTLYHSPLQSVEFEYRDRWGRLLGVGICDLCPESLSSVYFYFDPRAARRSLGTFSAVYEIQWARQAGLKYWYAGYWIRDCRSMAYKARFGPCQRLDTDGVWRELKRADAIGGAGHPEPPARGR